MDAELFAPVTAGLWRQYELYDGTYTYDDLLDIREMLIVEAESKRRSIEAIKRK